MKYFKPISVASLLLLSSLFCPTASYSQIKTGMQESELLKLRPNPAGKLEAGSRTIYKWSDLEVFVNKGVVSRVRIIDPKQVEISRRKATVAAMQRKQVKSLDPAKVEFLRKQRIASAVKFEREEAAKANAKKFLEIEKDRVNLQKKEIMRKGSYIEEDQWEKLRDSYLSAYYNESLNTKLGNNVEAKTYAKLRSRFELQLNKLSDKILGNENNVVDIRTESYYR